MKNMIKKNTPNQDEFDINKKESGYYKSKRKSKRK